MLFQAQTHPIPSIYGIFTSIWLIFMVSVGKYAIHGSYGHGSEHLPNRNFTQFLPPKTQDIVLLRTPQWERCKRQALLMGKLELMYQLSSSLIFDGQGKMHAFCWILGARSVCNLCDFRNLKPRRGLKQNIFPSHVFGLIVLPRRYLKRYIGKKHVKKHT